MPKSPKLAQLEKLVGDPERHNFLGHLMDGKAYTASELGRAVRLPVETIRVQLDELVSSNILATRAQGPHTYYALANCEIADMLVSILQSLAVPGRSPLNFQPIKTGPRDPLLRNARVCYGHLAGEMGVHMFDSLVARKYLSQTNEAVALTGAGRHFIADIGIDLGALAISPRPMCKTCLDWSVRRSHLGGILGKELLDRFIALSWAHRSEASRRVHFSVEGEGHFLRCFPA